MKKEGFIGSILILVIATGVLFVTACRENKSPASPKDSTSGGQETPNTVLNQEEKGESALSAAAAVMPVSDEGKNQTESASTKEETTGVHWFTNFEQARAKAVKEGKDMVLDFSGSDWCVWCMRLDKEVFSQDEFAKKAEQYFVFVLVDFPSDPSSLPPEIKKQNDRLARQYNFQGAFPTIYLTAPDGKPYAIASYQAGGPDVYFDYLMQIRKYRKM